MPPLLWSEFLAVQKTSASFLDKFFFGLSSFCLVLESGTAPKIPHLREGAAGDQTKWLILYSVGIRLAVLKARMSRKASYEQEPLISSWDLDR